MRGYEVVTSDERSVGRVVDVAGGYLVVESGRLFRSRRPIPREFAHAEDATERVLVTVPRRVLDDAPQADRSGRFDARAAARHYGLADSYLQARHGGPADELASGEGDVIAAGRARVGGGES